MNYKLFLITHRNYVKIIKIDYTPEIRYVIIY